MMTRIAQRMGVALFTTTAHDEFLMRLVSRMWDARAREMDPGLRFGVGVVGSWEADKVSIVGPQLMPFVERSHDGHDLCFKHGIYPEGKIKRSIALVACQKSRGTVNCRSIADGGDWDQSVKDRDGHCEK